MLLAAASVVALPACSTVLTVRDDGGVTELLMGHAELASDAEHGTRSRRVLPGLDVRWAGDWPGMAVGLSELTVLHANAGTPADDDGGLRYEPPLGFSIGDGEGARSWWGWFVFERPSSRAAALFVHSRVAGLVADPSGAGAPYARFSALVADPGADALHVIRLTSGSARESSMRELSGRLPPHTPEGEDR